MTLTSKEIYELLPAVYRVRDAEQNETLRALVTVMAEQASIVEGDIARLYENWFIETCDEWVVPYIGDLLDARILHSVADASRFNQRARVANTIRYRRRKGTATMLEQLAADATGWAARVVEFFQLLGVTQNINHLRHGNVRTPDLRDTDALELIDTAFDHSAHTVDVRRIAVNRGCHNLANIGIFLWRLEDYYLPRCAPRTVAQPDDGRYRISPLGLDQPLFNRQRTETDIGQLATEADVPAPLRRRPLYDELEARRQTLVDDPGADIVGTWFGERPVFRVFVQPTPAEAMSEVPADEILICDLSDPPSPIPEGWRRPPASKDYEASDGSGPQARDITVAVDPVLGRLAFPENETPADVDVSYTYGFSGDIGSGAYNRREALGEMLTRTPTWHVGVGQRVASVAGQIFATLAEAIQEWKLQPPNSVGIISILDSQTYAENLSGANRIDVPAGSQLVIVSADWPETPVPGGAPGQMQRLTGDLNPIDRQAHFLGDIVVRGTAAAASQSPGELILDGLLIEGQVTLDDGGNANLGRFLLAHSTIVPGRGGLSVPGKNRNLRVELFRSICGPVDLANTVGDLCIDTSIVDAGGSPTAIMATGGMLAIERSTVFGEVTSLELSASNCLFNADVITERRQSGCVRFCHLTANSKTPRRYRCQPDLALADAAAADHAAIRTRVAPSYTATTFGHPAYAQLGRSCADEIRRGADDGGEMGVFGFLRQANREDNLRASLDEYLRVGLEAGLIFVT